MMKNNEAIKNCCREMAEAMMPTILRIYKMVMSVVEEIATLLINSFDGLLDLDKLEALIQKAKAKERHRKHYERMYARGPKIKKVTRKNKRLNQLVKIND